MAGNISWLESHWDWNLFAMTLIVGKDVLNPCFCDSINVQRIMKGISIYLA